MFPPAPQPIPEAPTTLRGHCNPPLLFTLELPFTQLPFTQLPFTSLPFTAPPFTHPPFTQHKSQGQKRCEPLLPKKPHSFFTALLSY